MTIRITRQLVPTALITAAVALAYPAGAFAQPSSGEWDVGAYDQCVGSFDGNPLDSDAEHKRWEDHMKMCCEKTGGIFNYAGAGGCVAPPANPAQTRRDVPPVVVTQTLEPAAPPVVRSPGVVVETLAPAVVG